MRRDWQTQGVLKLGYSTVSWKLSVYYTAAFFTSLQTNNINNSQHPFRSHSFTSLFRYALYFTALFSCCHCSYCLKHTPFLKNFHTIISYHRRHHTLNLNYCLTVMFSSKSLVTNTVVFFFKVKRKEKELERKENRTKQRRQKKSEAVVQSPWWILSSLIKRNDDRQ